MNLVRRAGPASPRREHERVLGTVETEAAVRNPVVHRRFGVVGEADDVGRPLGRERVLEIFDSSKFKPDLKNNIPPTILKASTVIPKNEKISRPINENTTNMTHAVITPFSAIFRFSERDIPSTIDKKIAVNPMGLTNVNKEVKATIE